MTAEMAGRPVPTPWIDTQPAHLIDTAIKQIRSEESRRLDAVRRRPITPLRPVGLPDPRPRRHPAPPWPPWTWSTPCVVRPARPRYQSGMSRPRPRSPWPADIAHPPHARSTCDPLSPTHAVQTAEVDL